jgi:hypothetical protein
MNISNLDLILIKSNLDSVNEFLRLVQMVPDDDMPKAVVDLVKSAAHIATLKCEGIEEVLEGRAVHMVRQAGEA